MKPCRSTSVSSFGGDYLSLLRDIQALQDSRLRTRLKALSVITPSVACYKFAGEMGIRIFDRYEDILSMECIELVLELTGNPAIFTQLHGSYTKVYEYCIDKSDNLRFRHLLVST